MSTADLSPTDRHSSKSRDAPAELNAAMMGIAFLVLFVANILFGRPLNRVLNA